MSVHFLRVGRRSTGAGAGADVQSTLRLYVAATCGFALAAIGLAAVALPHQTEGQLRLSLLFAGLVALEGLWSVRLTKGAGHGETLAHEEILFVLMALLLPPASALAAFAVGVVARQLLARRGVLKTVFNAAQFVGSASLGFLAIDLLAPSAGDASGRVGAVVVAALLFSVSNRLVVSGVLAVAVRTSVREEMSAGLGAAALVWVGSVAFGVLAGLTAADEPSALPLVLVIAAVLSVGFSGHARARRERQVFSDLVESSAAAIFSVEADGRIASWNPQMARLTGRNAEAVAGDALESVARFFVADDASAIDVVSVSAKLGSDQQTLRMDAPAGERWVTVSRSNLPDGGFAFVAQDVTEQHKAEEQLRRSEAHQRFALDTGRMGWWEWDIESDEVRWSEGLELICGLEPGTFSGTYESFLAQIHPDDREHVDAAAATGMTRGYEELAFRIVRPDGEVRSVVDRGRVVVDADGRRVGMTGVTFDITEHTRAQALVSLQRQVLEEIAVGAPVADVLALLSRLVDEHSNGRLTTVITSGEELANSAIDGGGNGCELRPVVSPSGVAVGVLALHRDQHSPEQTELIAVARRLAGIAIERSRQAEQLANAEAKYRRLVERLPLAVYSFAVERSGLDYVFAYASPQIEAMLGYSPAEWEADPAHFRKLVHPEDAERVAGEILAARSSADRFQGEYRLVAKDGRVVWVHDESVYFRDETGSVASVEGFLVDVTERKALETSLVQAQKMEAVGRLAGGIAHDFNNLMSGVIGFGELVLDRLEPEDPTHGHVAQIVRAGERASAMTSQLLAFSRRQILQPRVVDVNEIVSGADTLLKQMIGEDVRLACHLGLDLEPVKADPVQLEQVIVNLAINARDAMPDGGLLTIETANVELDADYSATHFQVDAGRYVQIAVTDTGIGMDAETRRQVFEPFFTTKPEGLGTGLGLATVFGIVKQTGGDISVYSEPGHGTTFKILLPSVEERAEHGEERARPSLPRGSETILLVEDEEVVRDLALEVLERCGYDVLVAGSPVQALEIVALHEGEIDLLLTDVVMPELSGRALAERVLCDRPTIEVLYASGYADEAIFRHGVLEGEVSFLPKPLTPTMLAEKVRAVLDARHIADRSLKTA